MIKIKNIIGFIIIAAILLTSALSLTSCDKPEIYNLFDALLNKGDGSSEAFEAELNIEINKDYLFEEGILLDLDDEQFDAVPDEINFKITGELHHAASQNRFCSAAITIQMSKPDEPDKSDESDEFEAAILLNNDVLYVENNDKNNKMSRIILDLLKSTGFISYPVKEIFSEIIYAEPGRFLAIDLKDLDLLWFGQYAEQIEETFTIDSKFTINIREIREEPEPNPVAVLAPQEKYLDFNQIKSQVEKELLKVSGYRYTELNIVLNPADNTVNILAARENGTREVLEPFKSEVDLAAVLSRLKSEPETLLNENIIPMRYILELMGETVNWSNAQERAFILRGGERLYFRTVLVNTRSYTNLVQLLAVADYSVSTGEINDYIEFKITRNEK
jgi:hypothetical protein